MYAGIDDARLRSAMQAMATGDPVPLLEWIASDDPGVFVPSR
jgi:hypothetical protein